MTILRRSLAGVALALGLMTGASRLDAQQSAMAFVVVVHESNPISEVTREELSRMFLKKITVWRTKKPVLPVDMKENTKTREVFTRAVHRREVTSVASYWQQQIFAGRAVPPSQRATDADVLSFVAGNADAIGYVSPGAQMTPGVKVITVR